MTSIVGRTAEIKQLNKLYNSKKAQLIAVYGRRRVGKTFLIDETLKGKITFRHAGLSPIGEEGKRNMMQEQLKHFYYSLLMQGMKKSHVPESWLEAFFMLEQHLQQQDNGSRQVVFLDELPWMDTPRSGFLTAFEAFWNTWGCHRNNLMVVVAGSANSWIQDKFINNHGGLYGRITYEIKLSPFTLQECEAYFVSRKFRISRYDIAQCNMILGGIPYYLGYLKPELSLSQNIDQLFFGEHPLLGDEYDRLFSSIFSNPDEMKAIVGLLATRHSGFTRQEMVAKLGLVDNGAFSEKLRALRASDFIVEYLPLGEKKRNVRYKLTDPFCLFFHKYIKGSVGNTPNYWTLNQHAQSIVTWRGIAFEELCFRHTAQIKKALGVAGVASEQMAWTFTGDETEDGTQIDLVINRKDNVANMCEMKFYSEEFAVTGTYKSRIAHRINLLSHQLSPKVAIQSTLITTYGLKFGEYSGDFQQVVTLDDLFS